VTVPGIAPLKTLAVLPPGALTVTKTVAGVLLKPAVFLIM
jgi:hypothetical protein